MLNIHIQDCVNILIFYICIVKLFFNFKIYFIMKEKVVLSERLSNKILKNVSFIVDRLNEIYVCSFNVDSVCFTDLFVCIRLVSLNDLFVSLVVIESFCEYLTSFLHRIGLISLNCRFIGVNFDDKVLSFSIDL